LTGGQAGVDFEDSSGRGMPRSSAPPISWRDRAKAPRTWFRMCSCGPGRTGLGSSVAATP